MTMEIAAVLQTVGREVSSSDIERTTVLAEEHGFDALVVGDHVALPVEASDTYPWTPEGAVPSLYDADSECYDAFEVLSYAAGMTDDVRLATNVCVAPLRHPVVLTKLALTLDALSGGRVELGVSVGWLREEYEVLGVPYDERGARTDEFLELFELAQTNDRFAFDGEFHSFPETGFRPRPASSGSPSVWIGGTSGAALRRLGRFGDGLVTVWERPSEVRELKERMQRAWTDYEREGTPALSVMRPASIDPATDSDRPLFGSADDVIEDVYRYADAGATRLVLDFLTMPAQETHRQLELFGELIIPQL